MIPKIIIEDNINKLIRANKLYKNKIINYNEYFYIMNSILNNYKICFGMLSTLYIYTKFKNQCHLIV